MERSEPREDGPKGGGQGEKLKARARDMERGGESRSVDGGETVVEQKSDPMYRDRNRETRTAYGERV